MVSLNIFIQALFLCSLLIKNYTSRSETAQAPYRLYRYTGKLALYIEIIFFKARY